jgi:hypothetical protein
MATKIYHNDHESQEKSDQGQPLGCEMIGCRQTPFHRAAFAMSPTMPAHQRDIRQQTAIASEATR